MSQLHKQSVTQCEIIEAWLRCPGTTLLWGSEPLSKRNQAFMLDCYTLMSCIWLDVSHCPDLLNRRWVSALLAEPVDKVVAFFKDVDFQLIYGSPSEASFNRWRRATHPWAGQIIAPLQGNIHLFYADGLGLRRIRTALKVISRANFPEPLGLEEKAIAKWLDVCLEPPVVALLDDEAEILSRIFPRTKSWLRTEEFFPKFGPGSTNDEEVRTLEDKYLSFADDALLRFAARKYNFPTTDMPRRSPDKLVRVHEVNFAPKQLDQPRVVSREAASLMFYQLGTFDLMARQIRSSSWRFHVDFERADLNRDLAWEGSLTGEYATIDLSSASDTVRYDHVCSLFYKTCLREALIAFRSDTAKIDGMAYKPTYFGPMGSGMTFPVETAVFSAIVEAVMHRNSDRRAWRVYGDDIIIPTERSDELIERLTDLGFRVNLDKSFTSSSSGFKESCGGDYFKGENVRPVMVSRLHFAGLHPRKNRPSEYASLIDLANELYDYKLARLRVLKALSKLHPGWMFTDTGDSYLWSPDPTNYHLRHRYDSEIQSDLVECNCFKMRSPSLGGQPNEDVRLFEWFRARQNRKVPLDSGPTRIGRSYSPYIGKAWLQPAAGWRSIGESQHGERA